MNSPCGDHAVLVLRVSAMAVLATDLGGGMAEGIVCMCEGVDRGRRDTIQRQARRLLQGNGGLRGMKRRNVVCEERSCCGVMVSS
jgi:hypothetical protein